MNTGVLVQRPVSTACSRRVTPRSEPLMLTSLAIVVPLRARSGNRIFGEARSVSRLQLRRDTRADPAVVLHSTNTSAPGVQPVTVMRLLRPAMPGEIESIANVAAALTVMRFVAVRVLVPFGPVTVRLTVKVPVVV